MSFPESDPPDVIENRAAFERRIQGLPYGHEVHLRRAYIFAKEAHRDDVRDDGQRYFEHVRAVFNILHDEIKINDPILGAAAFLHDTIEDAKDDSRVFGSMEGMTSSQRMKHGKEIILNLFGEETSQITRNLTKPQIDGVEVMDKRQKDEMYHEQLVEGGARTIIVKMADRLHNLRTLGGRSHGNQIKIVNETRIEYYPLFQSIGETYPEQVAYLIPQMEKAISTLVL